MMNLGPRPTFGDSELSIEAHLFDVTRDFYGNRVRIDFVSFLRETRKFGSADELVSQLKVDRENAQIALTPLTRAVNLKGSIGTAHFTPSVA
jgi:riboflavin kinase/FMN adenylyltransferase